MKSPKISCCKLGGVVAVAAIDFGQSARLQGLGGSWKRGSGLTPAGLLQRSMGFTTIDYTSSQGMVVPLHTTRWQLCLVQDDYGGTSEAYLDLSYNSGGVTVRQRQVYRNGCTARLQSHRSLSNHGR